MIFPDYTGLATASQRFVIRKHSAGLFEPVTWWLYSPNGSRWNVFTFKAALKIALESIDRYEDECTAERMATIRGLGGRQ